VQELNRLLKERDLFVQELKQATKREGFMCAGAEVDY
jgi:hypothetical protein